MFCLLKFIVCILYSVLYAKAWQEAQENNTCGTIDIYGDDITSDDMRRMSNFGFLSIDKMCPDRWSYLGLTDSCYTILHGCTFEECELRCSAFGEFFEQPGKSHLATVKSPQEERFLFDLRNLNVRENKIEIGIGLKRHYSRKWIWVIGKYEAFNRIPLENTTKVGIEKNCALIVKQGRKIQMKSHACHVRFENAVCQMQKHPSWPTKKQYKTKRCQRAFYNVYSDFAVPDFVNNYVNKHYLEMDGLCPKQWTFLSMTNSCYIMIGRCSLRYCEERCQALGKFFNKPDRCHLTELHSTLEEKFLFGIFCSAKKTNLNQIPMTNHQIGIGLKKRGSVWMWRDNNEIVLKFHRLDEKSLHAWSEKQCVLVEKQNADFVWKRIDCNEYMESAVCQLKMSNPHENQSYDSGIFNQNLSNKKGNQFDSLNTSLEHLNNSNLFKKPFEYTDVYSLHKNDETDTELITTENNFEQLNISQILDSENVNQSDSLNTSLEHLNSSNLFKKILEYADADSMQKNDETVTILNTTEENSEQLSISQTFKPKNIGKKNVSEYFELEKAFWQNVNILKNNGDMKKGGETSKSLEYVPKVETLVLAAVTNLETFFDYKTETKMNEYLLAGKEELHEYGEIYETPSIEKILEITKLKHFKYKKEIISSCIVVVVNLFVIFILADHQLFL